MRWTILLGASFLSVGTAWAQNGGSEIVVPPAPTITPEAPQAPAPVQPTAQPPPGLVPVQPPAEGGGVVPVQPAQQPSAANSASAPPDVAPPQSGDWTPGNKAMLGVLNKVDGSVSQLSLSVGGQPQTEGDLSISMQACLTRPAGQIPDVAAFVTVTQAQQDNAPVYRGWMLRSAPGATFVGNAGQTFRIIGCS